MGMSGMLGKPQLGKSVTGGEGWLQQGTDLRWSPCDDPGLLL